MLNQIKRKIEHKSENIKTKINVKTKTTIIILTICQRHIISRFNKHNIVLHVWLKCVTL